MQTKVIANQGVGQVELIDEGDVKADERVVLWSVKALAGADRWEVQNWTGAAATVVFAGAVGSGGPINVDAVRGRTGEFHPICMSEPGDTLRLNFVGALNNCTCYFTVESYGQAST